ncbi:MAG: NUDIX domain-containing protein [Nanoarchaeota archaeon]
MPREALVVKREILFKNKHFEGFLEKRAFDYISLILNNCSYSERSDELEHDRTLKQIIPYIIIINKKEKKIFAYKRANNDNYSEKRLRNKWSIGVGGHIERIDNKNPIQEGMMRELKEELKMDNYPIPKIIGYVNDDSGNVESVHFGIIALAKTSEDIKQGDDEMEHSSFYTIDEFESLISKQENELEGWSKIIWPVVKSFLQ